MKNVMKSSESGRTMLEMLGVLGIMGIIMYGAIAGINYGMNTYKVNQVYNEVQEAVQGIEDLYSWRHDYPQDMGAATDPDNDIFNRGCGGGRCLNSFNGSIKVKGVDCTGAGVDAKCSSFKVVYCSIPKTECDRLSEMEWGPVYMGGDCNNNGNNNIPFCPKGTAAADCIVAGADC